MSEPGRFSLEKLVTASSFGWQTLIAAGLALIAALTLSREAITRIPELVETSYGYDSQLRWTVATRSMATSGLPVTFVDVDDVAIRSFGGATRTTPRAILADLIKTIVAKKPAVLFVDFDLGGTAENDGDEALKAYLREYPQTQPPLLLTREMSPLNCPDGRCAPTQCETPAGNNKPLDAEPTVRSWLMGSPFAAEIASKRNIRWVSSIFAPDGDGVVRSWRLWANICTGDNGHGTPQAIPSVELAAAALFSPAQGGNEALDRYMASLTGAEPNGNGAAPSWPANTHAYDTLIPFLIGGTHQNHVSDWQGASGFRYQRVAALSVMHDEVAETALAGRVVVLGASYGNDKLKTPFGVMPGAALIANAIAVAPAILDHEASSKAILLPLTILLAAIYGLLAKSVRAIPAAVAILGLSYVWLSLATHWLNPEDAVHTVSLALVVLGAFLTLDAVLEIGLDLLDGKGLSAFLRNSKALKKSPSAEKP